MEPTYQQSANPLIKFSVVNLSSFSFICVPDTSSNPPQTHISRSLTSVIWLGQLFDGLGTGVDPEKVNSDGHLCVDLEQFQQQGRVVLLLGTLQPLIQGGPAPDFHKPDTPNTYQHNVTGILWPCFFRTSCGYRVNGESPKWQPHS